MNDDFNTSEGEKNFNIISFNQFFSNALNFIALLIICFIIIFFYNKHFNNNQDVLSANLKLQTIPHLKTTDSLIISKQTIKDFEILRDTLNKQIGTLTQIREELIKSDIKKQDDLKYYSTIIGFILAIVGFFGFKSIHDARESATKNATEEAKSIARQVSETTAKLAIDQKNYDSARKIEALDGDYAVLKEGVNSFEDLQGRIIELELRLKDLENSKIESATTEKNEDPDIASPNEGNIDDDSVFF